MGRLFLEVLEGRKYACKECLASGTLGGRNCVHLASSSDLLSKNFHSRRGPAYLFNSVVNVTYGAPEEREMTTGRHLIRELFCVCCGSELGWVYDAAYEQREKYKEGKFILERLQLVDLDAAAAAAAAAAGGTAAISAASPGSSPGSAGLGSDPGAMSPPPQFSPTIHHVPRPYMVMHPHAAAAAAAAAATVEDDPSLPEIRAFFTSWAPNASVPPVSPPFNINNLNL